MLRWQYKLISTGGGRTFEDGERIAVAGFAAKPPNLLTKFQEVGAQGWELVTVIGDQTVTQYWFKKQLPSPPPVPGT